MAQAEITVTAEYAERLLEDKLKTHQRVLDDINNKSFDASKKLDVLREESVRLQKEREQITKELDELKAKKSDQEARLKQHEKSVLEALALRESATAQKEGDAHALMEKAKQSVSDSAGHRSRVMGVRDDVRKALSEAQKSVSDAATKAEKVFSAIG